MLGKTNGGGGGFDPSDIQSGTIAVDNILGLDTLGSIVKGNLAGQYVRVIPAPASTTLTDELIAVFKEGVFVNGNFLGMHNPVFFPCGLYNGTFCGVAIGLRDTEGSEGRYTSFYVYTISSSKEISAPNKMVQIGTTGNMSILKSVTFSGLVSTSYLNIKSKDYPDYPTTNTTPKVLQIAPNGGSLSWGDVPSPAVVAYEGTSLLPTDVVFEDWTLHRAIKDGNVLWVVGTGKIKNNGAGATISNLFEITLPSEISSKIYREDGTTCDSAYSSSDLILATVIDFQGNNRRVYLRSSTANKIIVDCNFGTLSANSTAQFDCRIPIFLNIGD